MMNEQPLVMVNLGAPEWTLRAVHAACTLTRNIDGHLVFLQLVFVNNPGFLGERAAHWNFHTLQRHVMTDYLHTAEDYGIEAEPYICQCFTLPECLIDIASHMQARVVFANLPDHRVQLWHHYQMWSLRRGLAHSHCQLISLENSSDEVLTITLPKETFRAGQAH